MSQEVGTKTVFRGVLHSEQLEHTNGQTNWHFPLDFAQKTN
jgi:hypothetical protein